MFEPFYSFPEMQTKALLPRQSNTSLKIAVLRNITLEAIEIPLSFYASERGYQAETFFGGFDTILQDVVNKDSVINSDIDLILVYHQLMAASPKLFDEFCQLSGEERDREAEHLLGYINSVMAALAQRVPEATILWHNFEVPTSSSFGLADPYLPQGKTHFIRSLNSQIEHLAAEYPNCKVVESDLIVRQIGEQVYYDWRYWHIARSPYSRQALTAFAKQDIALFEMIKGKAKKCLVLDCDNTLWGGIVGEEGTRGIKLGESYPGIEYKAFQKHILELHSRGVILALCSKNNEQDVWDVFDKHPEMLLKREHIAAHRINWLDKATNIASMSSELNLGLDSLVFLDDSPYEVEQVQYQLPEVTSICLNVTQSTQFASQLRASRWFDTLLVTWEDGQRGAMYQAQRKREEYKSGPSLEDYLAGLEMSLTFSLASEETFRRVAQQTQKTNQFNLTTFRHDERAISAFMLSNKHRVYTLTLKDRFGDMGVVGSAVVSLQGVQASIDTFLLSCRVLGRKVEQAFLALVMTECVKLGCQQVIGRFVASKKNQQVHNFYLTYGFVQLETLEQGEIRYVNEPISSPYIPNFFKINNQAFS